MAILNEFLYNFCKRMTVLGSSGYLNARDVNRYPNPDYLPLLRLNRPARVISVHSVNI